MKINSQQFHRPVSSSTMIVTHEVKQEITVNFIVVQLIVDYNASHALHAMTFLKPHISTA